MVHKIFMKLNSEGECTVRVDPANSINLKLFPKLSVPPSPRPWDVPIIMKVSDWYPHKQDRQDVP